MKNWLLTGRPGVGKTIIVRVILQSLLVEAGGFFTEEIREEGKRVGFKLCELGGREGILSHVSLLSPYRVGRYGVKIETMESVAIPALRKAIAEKDLIVIDEIGRMELFCPSFPQAILEALDSPKPVLGVLQERATSLSRRIKEREDTRIIMVTLANRDRLPEVVLQELRTHLEGSSTDQDRKVHGSAGGRCDAELKSGWSRWER